MEFFHFILINNQLYVVKKFKALYELIFYLAAYQTVYEDLDYQDFPSKNMDYYGNRIRYGNKLINDKGNIFAYKLGKNYYRLNIESYFEEIYKSAKFLENNPKKYKKTYKGKFRKDSVEGISNKRNKYKYLFRRTKRYQILKQQTDSDKEYRARKRKCDAQFAIEHIWLDDCSRSRGKSKSWKNQKKKRQWM